MTLVYGSICSGIEAASVAWHPLGWRAAFLSEIEAFPRAVLKHHYPDVPLHGDFTTIREGEYAAINVLVGGTPCQSFSVAGLRGGLADQRGNLALEYLRLAQRLRPEWLVWENVPGVLSSNGGRDFGAIIGGMVELGYCPAWRVLDAQYVRVDGLGRAVPQRRRRVFVVGHLGDWRRAAAVLFERESLSGNPPPRRETGQGVAGTLAASSGRGSADVDDVRDGRVLATRDAAATLTRGAESAGRDGYAGRRQEDDDNLVAYCLNAKGGAGRTDAESETLIPCMRSGGGFDAIAFAENNRAELRLMDGDGQIAPQLTTGGGKPGQGQPCIAFHARQGPDSGPVTHPLDTQGSSISILSGWRVRRLTPTECERLQGFPDGYTAIPYGPAAGGQPKGRAKDSPRYKALGNSMAVNVMRWIGLRIAAVDSFDLDVAITPTT